MSDKKTTTLAVPSIHLNGTGRQELFRGYYNAVTALHAAVEAVQATAPHARDYYVQGSDAYTVANRQHLDRLRRIEAIRTEIQDIALAVMDNEK
jgi:hypothetical protein